MSDCSDADSYTACSQCVTQGFTMPSYCDDFQGTCFRSDATVTVKSGALRSVPKPLSKVKVGDVVETVHHVTHAKSWSKVVALPHSKSVGNFIEVTMEGSS